jgi:hypothetical protein
VSISTHPNLRAEFEERIELIPLWAFMRVYRVLLFQRFRIEPESK